MKRALAYFAVCFTMLTSPMFAQITLSGVSMWSTNSSGAGPLSGYWNTLGSETDSGSVANVYLSGSGANTSGDTNASLNPNLSLTAGTYVIQLAGHTVNLTHVGINLYFNGDLSNNRITAVVPDDGTTNFSVVTGATTTVGEGAGSSPVTGSGSLSYASGGFLVTLTSMSTTPSHPAVVGYYSVGAAGGGDTVASITLTVTAVPEPASFATGCGIAVVAAGFLLRRKRASSL